MYEILSKKVKKVGKKCLYGEVFYFYFMINWDY